MNNDEYLKSMLQKDGFSYMKLKNKNNKIIEAFNVSEKSANELQEFEHLENIYLQKLSIYTRKHKILMQEYNQYLNQHNSLKNTNFEGQNVFVGDLNYDRPESSLGCYSVDTKKWHKAELNSDEVNVDSCNQYAIFNNKQYFGLLESNGNRECYVSNENHVINNTDAHPVKYWKSPKGGGNVLSLGINGIIALFHDHTGSWWQSQFETSVYWTAGNEIKNCHPKWGGTITEIQGTYGGNCESKSNWDSKIGIDNVTKKLNDDYLHKSGGNFLISNRTFGDPAYGCGKGFSMSYKCGNVTKSPFVRNPYAEGTYASINCSDEIKNCPTPILKLFDNGDLCILKSEKDPTSIWCLSSLNSNVNNIDTISINNFFKSGWGYNYGFERPTNLPGAGGATFNNVNWLLNRDYIKAGEPFKTGMLLASKSGNCAMIIKNDGYLYLYYAKSACKTEKDSLYGNDSNTLGLYKLKETTNELRKNVGKVGYVQDNGKNRGKLKKYPNHMIQSSSIFSKPLLNTSSNYNETTTSLNKSFEDCKKDCIDKDNDCIGITWSSDRGGTCNLSNANNYTDFLNNRRYAKNKKTAYRLPKINNNNSCNKNVNTITNSQWNKYSQLSDMTPDFKCGIAAITMSSKNELDNAYKELEESVNNIYKKLSSLTSEEEKLINSHGYNTKKLRDSVQSFHEIQKKYTSEERNLNNFMATHKDSLEKLMSDDKKYLIWSILTILTVIGTFTLLK
uniref:Uncharacterized protein n=1 Tax=viral metagenome TaxID=1070528 RepID=A0A6C0AYM8_9ZZZZ|tara:strand:- start:362 stop:2557 length:2196 start_codon:yes stop_codon:yes gene_type:complete